MGKLDLNLDAYRQISVILHRVRKLIREELRAVHGDDFEASIPNETLELLRDRQELEASINWSLNEPADVLDFAGFSDLHEILAFQGALLKRFAHLASDPKVLHIRFLELQTIQDRIAFARPISESDLSFLISFEDRMKKSLGAAPTPPAAKAATPEARGKVAEPPAAAPPPVPEAERVQRTATQAATKTVGRAAAASQSASAKEAAQTAQRRIEVVKTAQSAPDSVAGALDVEDDENVLSALYREVTTMADALSSANLAAMQTSVWERVRDSSWYQRRFASLGLKPVSEFFDLLDGGRRVLANGGSRNELREYLKDHNFPKVVLALRAVFRPHQN
jgi:hypothetical protein